MIVQQALLGVGLDDLAQGLPAQLLGRESWRLAIYPIWRPEAGKQREEEEESSNKGKMKVR